MRHTGQAGAKAGYSDPRALCGRCRAYRIKATSGITESSRLSVPSVGVVCYIDIGVPMQQCIGAVLETQNLMCSQDKHGLITVNPKLIIYKKY